MVDLKTYFGLALPNQSYLDVTKQIYIKLGLGKYFGTRNPIISIIQYCRTMFVTRCDRLPLTQNQTYILSEVGFYSFVSLCQKSRVWFLCQHYTSLK